MTTTEEDTGSGNGVSTVGESSSGACVVGGSVSGGGVIMENLIEKSLYDIGDPDLMDVWDTDLNAVSKKAELRKLTPRRDGKGGVTPFVLGPACVHSLSGRVEAIKREEP